MLQPSLLRQPLLLMPPFPVGPLSSAQQHSHCKDHRLSMHSPGAFCCHEPQGQTTESEHTTMGHGGRSCSLRRPRNVGRRGIPGLRPLAFANKVGPKVKEQGYGDAGGATGPQSYLRGWAGVHLQGGGGAVQFLGPHPPPSSTGAPVTEAQNRPQRWGSGAGEGGVWAPQHTHTHPQSSPPTH